MAGVGCGEGVGGVCVVEGLGVDIGSSVGNFLNGAEGSGRELESRVRIGEGS